VGRRSREAGDDTPQSMHAVCQRQATRNTTVLPGGVEPRCGFWEAT
jgi:hypothetical protein